MGLTKKEVEGIMKIIRSDDSDGAKYITKVLDYIISNKIKPLDINLNEVYRVLAVEDKYINVAPSTIKTDIARTNKRLRHKYNIFDNCIFVTPKKLIINIVDYYNNNTVIKKSKKRILI